MLSQLIHNCDQFFSLMSLSFFSFHFKLSMLLLLLSSCVEKEVTKIGDITCDILIQEEEIILSDPLNIDLSSVSSIVKYADRLFISQYNSGKIMEYSLEDGSIRQISLSGRGPNEFNSPMLYSRDNILYIYDLILFKIGEFDMDENIFLEEYTLDEQIRGDLLHVEQVEGSIEFYFIRPHRDRSVSNNTFNDLIVYSTLSNTSDILLTVKDSGRLNYWDERNNSDFSFYAPIFNNTVFGVVNDTIVYAETNNFFVQSFADSLQNIASVEFEYDSDYEYYINQIIDSIRDGSQSNPDISINAFHQALRRDTRNYDAIYSTLLFSDSYLLFHLFSRMNAFLIYSLLTGESYILCSEAIMEPVLIDDNIIYWIKENKDFMYQLIKTKM